MHHQGSSLSAGAGAQRQETKTSTYTAKSPGSSARNPGIRRFLGDNEPMAAATALMVLGFVLALVGVAVAVRARFQAGPAADVLRAETPIDGFDDVLERVQVAFRATDSGLRAGVALVVVGLLLAGAGAYLDSDARALGADVGSGKTDHARVGGTW
jgi:hypothetical protein